MWLCREDGESADGSQPPSPPFPLFLLPLLPPSSSPLLSYSLSFRFLVPAENLSTRNGRKPSSPIVAKGAFPRKGDRGGEPRVVFIRRRMMIRRAAGRSGKGVARPPPKSSKHLSPLLLVRPALRVGWWTTSTLSSGIASNHAVH